MSLPEFDQSKVYHEVRGYRAELILQHALKDEDEQLRAMYGQMAIDFGICTKEQLAEWRKERS